MVVAVVWPVCVAGVRAVLGSDVAAPRDVRMMLLRVGIKVVRRAAAEIYGGTLEALEQTTCAQNKKRPTHHFHTAGGRTAEAEPARRVGSPESDIAASSVFCGFLQIEDNLFTGNTPEWSYRVDVGLRYVQPAVTLRAGVGLLTSLLRDV